MKQSKIRTYETAKKYDEYLKSGKSFDPNKAPKHYLIKEWEYFILLANGFPHDNLPYKTNHVIWCKVPKVDGELYEEWDDVKEYVYQNYNLIAESPTKSVPKFWHRHCYKDIEYYDFT